VTNDAFAPLRARRLTAVPQQRRAARRFASRRGAAGQAVQGRWSLTDTLFRDAPPAGPRMRAQAELMLERYGIVTRETVLAEGVPGGFSSLYGELSNLEMLGTARRGYFVEGLGGAQFALAGAVERLRGLPRAEGEYLLMAATDPAQPYGAALPWPRRAEGRRPARTPGAFVLLRDGNPILYVERGGKGIVRLVDLEGEELTGAVAEIADAARQGLIPKLGIERLDGDPVIGSGYEETLIAAGFSRQPRRLVASA
jgi:ATP-dependent Lhr-like helicase